MRHRHIHPRTGVIIGAIALVVMTAAGCGSSSSSTAASSTTSSSPWSSAASLASARFGLAAGVMNNVLYIAGGTLTSGTLTSANGGNGLTSLTSYNPATNVWADVAAMPTGRFGLAVGVLNSFLYAVGGRATGSGDALTSLESYNPLTNSWTARTAMLTSRYGLGVGVMNNVLYAVGGTLTSAAGGTGLTSLESFNPTTNTWASAKDMPTARFDLAVGVLNSVLYAVGGRATGSGAGLTTVESYNPLTNAWSTAGSMSTGRYGLAVDAMNNRLYAVGGTLASTAGGTGVTTVESYNPTTNVWSTVDAMPTGRFGLAVGVLNSVGGALRSTLYAVGGRASGSGDGLNSLESYRP